MDRTVSASAADGLNPRCMAAVYAFRTRRLRIESAAWLDPRHRLHLLPSPFTVDVIEPRSVASEHGVLDRFPRLGSTRARRPRRMSHPNSLTGVSRAVWPRSVPSKWPSRSTIRGSPLSAVYARGSPASLHLVYLTPSSPFILLKPSYLQLEPHETYNTTYAYAMHLIGL
ncbi:hypothetical protein F2Q68_00034875 [Brassica cretica]|uniref:Uncharacterized protein n=1 Tax=Brassica cretica TaxID=69181 RepID=A0A8S9H6K3_BRACR|nr:hypothetical protein F2Q68_00034875 [Brassica cretica]